MGQKWAFFVRCYYRRIGQLGRIFGRIISAEFGRIFGRIFGIGRTLVKFEFVEFEMVQLIEIVGNCMRRAERNELNGKLVGCIWMHCCINMYRPSLSCKKY